MGQLGPLGWVRPIAGLGPITRLRMAFVALGVALLLPLAFLLEKANDRLEAQRQLRHQVVAERIFDELERELTLLLQSEAQRPSSAYSLDTSIAAWAPFIVGYFTADGQGTRYVADQQLDASRRSRLERALGEWRSGEPPKPETADERDLIQDLDTSAEAAAPRQGLARDDAPPSLERQKAMSGKSLPSPRSSPEVLRQLNRADAQRRQQSAPQAEDPLRDYGY